MSLEKKRKIKLLCLIKNHILVLLPKFTIQDNRRNQRINNNREDMKPSP